MNINTKPKILRTIWPVLLLVIIAPACKMLFPFGDRTLPVTTATPLPLPTPTVSGSFSLPVEVAGEQDVLINLYARVNPSVVAITIYAQQNGRMVPLAQGSGFVYDTERHIVTNAHVVRGAEQVEVVFSDGLITPAKLIGQDLNSDLAVIQADKVPGGIEPLPLAEMERLAVGQTVVAIGNSFGLEGTLTRGVISALGRNIPGLTQFSIPQAIQTDAAINPGNSGGPLLNLEGQVIGVNAQIETGNLGGGNTGVGFAIPVNVLNRVIPDLIQKGKTEWSWLGITGTSLNPTLVRAMELSIDRGAYILDVVPGGPADEAGLHKATQTILVNGRQVVTGGDVVVAVDNQPVHSFDDILVYVALSTRPGQVVKLSVLRDGKPQEIDVKLGTRPAKIILDSQP